MKLFKKIALVAVGATMAIGVGVGIISSNSFLKTEAVNYAAEADFTLKSESHGNYTDVWTYGSWSLFGAANNNGGWAFMKFGGKNTNLAQANPVYCRGQVATKAVSQIDVVFNAGNLTVGTVNSWGVKVYSDDSYDTLVDTVEGGAMTVKTAQTLSLIPGSAWSAGRYYEVYFDLANTTSKNGIVWVDKIQFVEQIDVSKTLTDLDYTGIPETTTYNEGDDFDSTGITVTATYSDSSTSDVTAQVIWADLTEGMTSVEGSYTYLSSTLTIEVTGLTVNAAPIIGGIVDGHAYLITAKKSTTADVQYVLKGGTAFASKESGSSTEIFTSAANYSLADAFVFTKTALNRYEIKSGTNYLSSINDNNGLVLGTTADSWTASVASGETTDGIPYDGIFLQDSSFSRYLTVYATTPNFRTYNSTTGQPLPAAVIILYDMTVLNGYAADFNEALGGVCVSNGSSNVGSLATAWSSVSNDFASLSAGQKAVFADTVNAVGDVAGTEIEQAIAKYEYVAAKYNTQLMASGWDFMARNITPASGSARLGEIAGGNNLLVIALTAVSTLGILGGIFYFRKRKVA